MKTLQKGDKGAEVKRWQYFLIGQKLDVGAADGIFGAQTHKATLEFQARHRLAPDGIVGLKTLGQAMLLGFDTLREKPALAARAGSTPKQSTPSLKAAHASDANWPPRPNFEPLASALSRQKLFGKYAYISAPVAGNSENIRIMDNWEDENILRAEK